MINVSIMIRKNVRDNEFWSAARYLTDLAADISRDVPEAYVLVSSTNGEKFARFGPMRPEEAGHCEVDLF